MKSQVDVVTLSRWVGNILSIVGYVFILHYDPLLGSSIKLIGTICILPFCFKLKLWDVVFVFGFFGILDISNIIRILLD